jgi:hypothetical protein
MTTRQTEVQALSGPIIEEAIAGWQTPGCNRMKSRRRLF